MDTKLLVTAGLQPQLAEMYALLLDKGQLTPPEAAQASDLTRTNAYKVLDRLVELGLIEKNVSAKKLTYQPSNPMALTALVGEARNQVAAQEEAAKVVMDQLLAKYYATTEQPGVRVVSGRQAVVQAFKEQIDLRESIYFMRSKADIPTMGFDTMHDLRVLPSHYGSKRFGITPDVGHGPTNPAGDKRSNLTRTWVKREDYYAPVEWSVSGSLLMIVLYGQEPHAITVANPMVADAFRQIWQIMDSCLRAMPYYADLPRTED